MKIFYLSLMLLSFTLGAQPIGSVEDAKAQQAEDKKWQQAIADFAAAPRDEVLGPYMQLITNLNHHPEYSWCSDNILGLIDQALLLNPSSLVAYSMRYTCATRMHQLELKESYLKSINGLVRALRAGKAADSIENVVEIRELMEAQLLLQAMGYTVLDIEMVTQAGGLYYRYHVLDPIHTKVSTRYFSNLKFMKRMLTNPNVSDHIAAQHLASHYRQQKMDFALTAQAKEQIARHQFDQALETLNQIEEYSMTKNLLKAQIYLYTQQDIDLKAIEKDLAIDAMSGYLDAKVTLAAIKLKEQSQENAEQIKALLQSVDKYTKAGEGAYRLAALLNSLSEQPIKTQAVDYLKQAVAQQHPKAIFTLARWYRSHNEQPKHDIQAMALLEQAHSLGIDEAAIEIAEALHSGSEQIAIDHQKELEILRSLAAKHHAQALYMLAQRHHLGVDLPQDSDTALSFYQQAYNQGHARAANQIGILYEVGALKSGEDLQKAFEWYQNAANLNDSNGLSNVGRFYYYGIGREVNLAYAANNFGRAAEGGDYSAYCKLADTVLQMESPNADNWNETLGTAQAWYQYGAKYDEQYCPRRLGEFFQHYRHDNEAAAYWLETAARAGDKKALESLEVLYFAPYVDKNYEKALKMLKKGMNLGMGKAAYYLGQMYHLSQGVSRDDVQALAHVEKAIELGYLHAKKAQAQLLLQGQMSIRDEAKAEQVLDEMAAGSLEMTLTVAEWLFYGWGFNKDYQLALKYYQIAADQGSGNAINHIGEMYRYGYGVDVDYQQAKRWYLKGVKANYILSAHNIAEMYYLGEGVEQNYLVAFDWFQKSAAANVSQSRYYLGKMYQQGLGVNQNIKLANRLFYQAMDAHHPDAKFEIGKNMIDGNGIKANPGRGLLLITEASEAGSQAASDYLKTNTH